MRFVEEFRLDDLGIQGRYVPRPEMVAHGRQERARMHGVGEHMLCHDDESNVPSKGIEKSSKSIGHRAGIPYTS